MEHIINKEISESELVDYIKEHPEVNYVAKVCTPYTYLCARAVISYLHEECGLKQPNGIFVVWPWQPGKWAITKEMVLSESLRNFYQPVWMKYKPEEDRTFSTRLKVIRKAGKNKEKDLRNVYFIHIDGVWDMLYVYAKANSNINFINIDFDDWREPYYNFSEWLRVMYARKSWFKQFIKEKIRKGPVQKMLMVMTGVNKQMFYCFDKKKFFSDKFVRYLNKIFLEESENYSFTPKNKYVLYLSNDYDSKTAQLVTAVAEEVLFRFAEKGYDIYVKQHPREKEPLEFHSIKVEYVPNHLAIESFIAATQNKPAAVIGAETTVMAKISSFWKIPCYCLLDNKKLKKNKFWIWSKAYNECAMRCIPEFKYSEKLKLKD